MDGPDGNTVATVDMGAVEFQVVAGLSLVVDTVRDENDGNYATGDLSLREAVALANGSSGANTITLASALAGQPILLRLGQMAIDDPLTIQGLGAALTTVNGQNRSRLFDITNNAGDVTFDRLTLTRGKTTAIFEWGGAIRSASVGQLTIRNSTLSGNSTTDSFAKGGGIYAAGSLTVTGSTVSGNSTTGVFALGGGIYANGSLTVTDSTVSGNSTSGNSARGGGIYADGSLTVTGSTLSGNSTTGSSARGGGIYAAGPLTVTGSTISGNSTTGTSARGAAFTPMVR